MKHIKLCKPYIKVGLLLLACLWLQVLHAQPFVKKMLVKDGKMIIEISKGINSSSLDSFITKYQLQSLGLMSYIMQNNTDSLRKTGWKVEKAIGDLHILSCNFSSFNKFNNPADRISFANKENAENASLFPSVSSNVRFGWNRFRNKEPFTVNGELVTFYLRGNKKANRVFLAGSFNNWKPNVLPMLKQDSGWIVQVKLTPGKYWYKFVIDGEWTLDNDNIQNENDNRGNVNSVYFKTNTVFSLNGFANAKSVFVAGSFNNWQTKQLYLSKVVNTWQLPIYLANGSYTYRFNADGKWMEDPANSNKLPNEFNEFNSVISLGKPHRFKLNGFANANNIFLVGDFNQWRSFELPLIKTTDGWYVDYVVGPGNYEYRFIVDGRETADPNNPLVVIGSDGKRNNFLVVEANYTFRIKGFSNAKRVAITGDFAKWNKNGLTMQKQGDEWVFEAHLMLGKHLYKLIVDDKWIIDPNNPLWEQNEFGTGNSIIWIEQL